jgi:maleylacetoacetate isomerase
MLTLYDYPRSSACYRVRIALHLKGLSFRREPVHLLRDGGEQFRPSYRALNPQARVPTLVLEDGTVLIQSPAILEWLEETHPDPPLLPRDPVRRARVRAAFSLIACDIHPLNNLAVLTYLKTTLGHNEEAVRAWYHHWIREGFTALESLIEGPRFCFGDAPSLADVALVPQVANAERYHLPLTPWPKIAAIAAHCNTLPAFAAARPEASQVQ